MACAAYLSGGPEQEESGGGSQSMKPGPLCFKKKGVVRARLRGVGFLARSQDPMIAHTWLPTTVLNES